MDDVPDRLERLNKSAADKIAAEVRVVALAKRRRMHYGDAVLDFPNRAELERIIGLNSFALTAREFENQFKKSIVTPHEHEAKGNPPVWLIWKRLPGGFPELDTVCDSEWSAAVHVMMAYPPAHIRNEADRNEVWVERIPANHRFASSLSEAQMKGYHSVRAWRKRHQLDGD